MGREAWGARLDWLCQNLSAPAGNIVPSFPPAYSYANGTQMLCECVAHGMAAAFCTLPFLPHRSPINRERDVVVTTSYFCI